jgi:hypothetical protein
MHSFRITDTTLQATCNNEQAKKEGCIMTKSSEAARRRIGVWIGTRHSCASALAIFLTLMLSTL